MWKCLQVSFLAFHAEQPVGWSLIQLLWEKKNGPSSNCLCLPDGALEKDSLCPMHCGKFWWARWCAAMEKPLL